jgi:hypothetical protein
MWNYLQGKHVDKLGREDKYFHNADVKTWQKKIQALMGSEALKQSEQVVDAGVN